MKNILRKARRKLAVAAVGIGSVFSTGCDIEEVLAAIESGNFSDITYLVEKESYDVMNTGDKSSLVARIRSSSEPPIWRGGGYQVRKPGIDSMGPHINVDRINPYKTYHIRPSSVLNAFRWPLWYIRNPITDSVIMQYQPQMMMQYGVTEGQIGV